MGVKSVSHILTGHAFVLCTTKLFTSSPQGLHVLQCCSPSSSALPLSVYADSCSLCCVQIDVLKMGWCKIGEKDGAKAIADLILFNTSLTTLDLRGNGLGNAGKRF